MRKELVVFIETNEQDELIRVSRVDDGTGKYMLLTAGVNRMVVDVAELMEAVGAIGHYSALFDQENKMREQRKKAPPIVVSDEAYDEIVAELEKPAKPNAKLLEAAKRHKAKFKEDEGALVLEAQTRSGPTKSELALEKQMRLMQGDSLVLKEK
jgi:hypothetical protein